MAAVNVKDRLEQLVKLLLNISGIKDKCGHYLPLQ